jgi:tetratricopeptide (TPR) repeat protein
VAADTLGVAYLKKRLPGPAAEQLRYAVELAERAGDARPVFHYHLGLALRDLGQRDEARSSFERALVLAGDFPEAEEVRRELEALRAAAPAAETPPAS